LPYGWRGSNVMMRTFTGIAVFSASLLLPGALVITASPAAADSDSSAPLARRVTIPAGTILRLRVDRGFGSDISRVEDPVSATLARAIVIDGLTVLPAGSTASGYVAEAVRPGRVKGRGRVAVRFTRIVPRFEREPSASREPYRMQTRSWVAVAPATKKKDAMTIGLPAAGGAAVGALIDGKKGAAIGAAAGGGAGTAVVLTTRGKDVRVGRGAVLSVRLTSPLTVSLRD
jgi:hypothetical protein